MGCCSSQLQKKFHWKLLASQYRTTASNFSELGVTTRSKLLRMAERRPLPSIRTLEEGRKVCSVCSKRTSSGTEHKCDNSSYHLRDTIQVLRMEQSETELRIKHLENRLDGKRRPNPHGASRVQGHVADGRQERKRKAQECKKVPKKNQT